MTTTYFTISKQLFINSIKESFTDKTTLLNAVKQDVPRMIIKLNGIEYHTYLELLEKLHTKHIEYLDIILLMCNQNAHYYYYEKIFSILQKDNIQLVSCQSKELQTLLSFTPLIRQITLKNMYHAMVINEHLVKIIRTIKVTLILDLSILDPVIVKIEYINTPD